MTDTELLAVALTAITLAAAVLYFRFRSPSCFPRHEWGRWEPIERALFYPYMGRTVTRIPYQQKVCQRCGKIREVRV